MRKFLSIFLLIIVYTSGHAQSFEGILQIDYRNESGARNAIDVYVKGTKFYMRKVFGGCDRYNAYIFDTRTRILSCLSPQSPRTALSLDIDKVLSIYENKQLKPGYKIHVDHAYTVTSISKKIADISSVQKKAADQDATYEIWTADLKINFGDLIPILRVIGFWGDAEDDDNAILESKTVNKKTSKYSTINVTPVKSKVDDSVFIISDSYQFVDLDKFLVNEYKSPRFGELVKAFTGF
jgi:uncharacterized ParB-like nuclease family protein